MKMELNDRKFENNLFVQIMLEFSFLKWYVYMKKFFRF